MRESVPPLSELGERDFEEGISQRNLLGAQILHGAFVVGPVIFMLVVIGLAMSQEPVEPPVADPGDNPLVELMPILSGVHAFMALGCWIVGAVIAAALRRPERLRKIAERFSRPGESAADRYFIAYFQPAIVRIALFEAPALFGIVICLIGTFSSDAATMEPVYWANLASTIPLLLLVALTFPTRDRIVEAFRGMITEAR